MLLNSEFGQDLLVIHDPSQIEILQGTLVIFPHILSLIGNLCLHIYCFPIYNWSINLKIF